LTDEYVYRVAPDGKSTQAALDLLRRGAFRDLRMSAGGVRLEGFCQGSDPTPYQVQVDLTNLDKPWTGCNCVSRKHPCKHALGLMFLAARSPEAFAGGTAPAPRPRQRQAAPMQAATAREAPPEEVRAPADLAEALFQAILAEPEEDTPRLVYADWLEEQGGPQEQARAEFIRVQIELAKSVDQGRRTKELRAREKVLWKDNREAWLLSLPEHLRKRNIRFHRGFFDELHMPTRSWEQHGEALFGQNPLYRLRLSGTVDRHAAGSLAVLPYLSRVRVLSLAGCQLEEPMKTLQILFGTPFLSGLTRLELCEAKFSSRELGVLVESPLLGRLRELDLARNDVGPRGTELLAGSAAVVNLRVLSLANNPIDDSGGLALAGSPHLSALARLDLLGVQLGEKAKAALQDRFGQRVLLG
jgi:uncharacterized protein (TIGR02996 family)